MITLTGKELPSCAPIYACSQLDCFRLVAGRRISRVKVDGVRIIREHETGATPPVTVTSDQIMYPRKDTHSWVNQHTVPQDDSKLLIYFLDLWPLSGIIMQSLVHNVNSEGIQVALGSFLICQIIQCVVPLRSACGFLNV